MKNWRIGKDRPSEENLENLKNLVRRKGKTAFLGYIFSKEDFINMFLPSLDIEAENKEEEIALHYTLEYFTNVLFYYCYYNENVKSLINDVQENTIKQTGISIASSFFDEVHSLKVTRNYYYDEEDKQNMPNLKEYFDMSNKSVDYVLKKDQRILDKIFTDEHIQLLMNYADTNFDVDKKEALNVVVKKLQKNEGVRPLILVTDVRFRKLYHPNNREI